MKLFALKDRGDAEGAVLAVLSYHPHEDGFLIDLPRGADPWSEPFVLSSFAARGEWTIGPEWSKRWVQSRIVPRSRQNLGEVLKANGLDRYDEAALLAMTKGENSQDGCYLEPLPLGDAPKWYVERIAGRLADAVPLEGRRLLVAFVDSSTGLVDLAALESSRPEIGRVLEDEAAFESVQVRYGGRMACWGSSAALMADELAATCTALPLSWGDFARFAETATVDASEAAAILGCSRQNVNAMVKRGTLRPLKAGSKSTLFLRSDVLGRR